ncbi:MAG: hypothetical protein IT440_07960 [Phycisphaeraceae bacterium]|nr:hypothetical protein [Phycisphaeraceae bacterium]
MQTPTKQWIDAIRQVRYAPPGEFIKDHALIRHDGLWHFFSISGGLGHSWLDVGHEECISHSTSADLIHWTMRGHPVEASRRPGYGDEHMAVAPFVTRGDDGRFYMFYSGWQHPHKRPNFSLEGHRQSIYMAVSEDLFHWEIPSSIAPGGIRVMDGDPILGRDPHVVRDDEHGRWLLYYTQEYLGTRPQAIGVATSTDLWNWRHLEPALIWTGERLPYSPTESPFVLRHPRSGQWLLILNWHYAVSDDPLRFTDVHPLGFPCGLTGPRPDGKGWQSIGVGFARELICHDGQNLITGVMGEDGYTKLGFTPFTWTDTYVALDADLMPRV